MLNNQVNENLEALLGNLHLVEELCIDAVDKLYWGEESLTEICSELDCVATPAAQKVAQYVSSYMKHYNVSTVYTVSAYNLTTANVWEMWLWKRTMFLYSRTIY